MAEYHIYDHFVIFLAILAKNWLPWQRPLDPCNQKCLLWIGRPRKPPVISNHILAISRRNSFICIYSNFSPNTGCHGNGPLILVYESLTNEFPDRTNPISKPDSAWMCCIQLKLWPFLWFFGLFWTKFGCHDVPLDPCNQKCLLWIGRPRKPSVISNHILVISHRNAHLYAFTAILVPKLVAMVTPLCSFVYGSDTDEFHDSTNPISKPNSARICCIQLKFWPFWWFLWPILAKIRLPWQRPMVPWNQKCLLWISRPWKPRYK